MSSDDTLAISESVAADSTEAFSVAWWERRTAEELRDIIKRGFSGGSAFEGAVAEAERRARIATTALRAAAAEEAERRRKLKRAVKWIAVVVVAVLGAWLLF